MCAFIHIYGQNDASGWSEQERARERETIHMDGNCELALRPDSSNEIMHVQMDLFNVLKRYAHFGEQNADKMAKVECFHTHTQKRTTNEHIIFIQIDAHIRKKIKFIANSGWLE